MFLFESRPLSFYSWIFLGQDTSLQFVARGFICSYKVPQHCACQCYEVVAAASALETGIGTDDHVCAITVIPGCPPRHPLVSPGEHPVPKPRAPSHILDPCGIARRTHSVHLCRADHQVPPRPHHLQDLCILCASPILFLIPLSAALISPFAYHRLLPRKQLLFFSHGCQICYICTQIKC